MSVARVLSGKKAMALLSGNEAIALGAKLAGIRVASAYPGTPSTEILETLSEMGTARAEWAPNEKVALDVAIGAAYAGARSMAVMKHVGVNVASDSLFYASYTGVNAGLILVSADDPEMHSSQNEQDNRHYGRFAKVPVIEPADSEEAKNFVAAAVALSELYQTPVMLRTTTRISHSKSLVEIDGLAVPPEFSEVAFPAEEEKTFERDPLRLVMVPAHARLRHPVVVERMKRLADYAESSSLNRVEPGEGSLGIVTAGVTYQYTREVFPRASVFKLGMTYPLPKKALAEFASWVDRLLVIEELDPFIEEQLRALGITVAGKEIFPETGELNPRIIRERAFQRGLLGAPRTVVSQCSPWAREGLEVASPTAPEEPALGGMAIETEELPGRPPVLCPGCGHRGVFYALKKMKVVVFGDIGCYTLGVAPPLSAMDFCGCMGAGIGVLHGALLAGLKEPAVAVIGDSTFYHSGIAPLMNIIYNKGVGVTIILDNAITAMTGHQDNPGSGRTLAGEEAPVIDLEKLIRAMGVDQVETIVAYDFMGIMKVTRSFLRSGKPGVIIARYPCVLHTREQHPVPVVKRDLCTDCGICLRIGCPPLLQREGYVDIDPIQCNGCGLCIDVCPFNAIVV